MKKIKTCYYQKNVNLLELMGNLMLWLQAKKKYKNKQFPLGDLFSIEIEFLTFLLENNYELIYDFHPKSEIVKSLPNVNKKDVDFFLSTLDTTIQYYKKIKTPINTADVKTRMKLLLKYKKWDELLESHQNDINRNYNFIIVMDNLSDYLKEKETRFGISMKNVISAYTKFPKAHWLFPMLFELRIEKSKWWKEFFMAHFVSNFSKDPEEQQRVAEQLKDEIKAFKQARLEKQVLKKFGSK